MFLIGDKVHVVWPGESSIEGIVRYIPQSAGEGWIIETASAIHYVQQFEDIWKSK